MKIEANVCLRIVPLDVGWSKHQVKIVDPHYVIFFLDLDQGLHELFVDVLVSDPKFIVYLAEFAGIASFEVVKQRTQVKFNKKVHHLKSFFVKEDGNAFLLGQECSYSLFFIFISRADSRPANPLEV